SCVRGPPRAVRVRTRQLTRMRPAGIGGRRRRHGQCRPMGDAPRSVRVAPSGHPTRTQEEMVMTEVATRDNKLNGVDKETLFATIDAVKQQPEAAAFQFRASNRWISGTHNRTTISGFFGAGQEHQHERTFVYDADHPAVLVGDDNGPTAVE